MLGFAGADAQMRRYRADAGQEHGWAVTVGADSDTLARRHW